MPRDQTPIMECQDENHALRVGFFCDPAQRGGVQTYTMNLRRHLRSHGCECVLLVRRPQDQFAKDFQAEVAGQAHQVVTYGQTRTESQLIKCLRERINGESLDIFIPNFRMTTYAACARLNGLLRPRILGVCHDDSSVYYRMLSFYEACIDKFVCPSLKTHRTLSTLLPERANDIRYIPHFLELPDVDAPSPPRERINLLYHGRVVEQQKNAVSLVRLGAILHERRIPFHMTIVGEGADKDRCRSLAADLGLTDFVDFQNACSYGELVSYFSEHHVSVLTSSHEGFCFSLAEAMSAGLPGLAFECGGVIEEYLHNGVNGFVVPFGDLEGMAERILLFLENPMLWKQFSAAAQATFRGRYASEPVVHSYLELFRETVNSPRRSNWPWLRPAHPDERPRLLRSAVQRIGASLGAWPDTRSIAPTLQKLGIPGIARGSGSR